MSRFRTPWPWEEDGTPTGPAPLWGQRTPGARWGLTGYYSLARVSVELCPDCRELPSPVDTAALCPPCRLAVEHRLYYRTRP